MNESLKYKQIIYAKRCFEFYTAHYSDDSLQIFEKIFVERLEDLSKICASIFT